MFLLKILFKKSWITQAFRSASRWENDGSRPKRKLSNTVKAAAVKWNDPFTAFHIKSPQAALNICCQTSAGFCWTRLHHRPPQTLRLQPAANTGRAFTGSTLTAHTRSDWHRNTIASHYVPSVSTGDGRSGDISWSTVGEFHRGKEFLLQWSLWWPWPQTSKKQQKKNSTCLHPALVVSSKCPEDVAVQFVLKRQR